MAKWDTVVELGDLHQAYHDGKIPISEVAKIFADRLEENKYSILLKDEIAALRKIEDVDDFDDVLADIYDFADFNHRIWIRTI